MSFDTDSLERAISTRQQEIKRILDELTKIRSDLLEAEDELVQLTHEKELLSKYIKKKALDDGVVHAAFLDGHVVLKHGFAVQANPGIA